MTKKCSICKKPISDERLEKGFDDPNEYPRDIHHELKNEHSKVLHSVDYIVCSRRCHDMTFMQFKGEIALKVFKTDNRKVTVEMPKMKKGMIT